MNVKFCKTCGASLAQKDAYTWECNYCHNVYSDKSVKEETERLLRLLISESKLEAVANLRKNLYDAINAEYTDSEEIIRICGEIKMLLPDDSMANFYYTANHGTPKEICAAIRGVDTVRDQSLVDGIVAHILKALRPEYSLPLQNLVERAYKKTDTAKFEKLSTAISEESVKVNKGIYETGIPRKVFIAYSSKDMDRVEELVEYLEDNGIDCFVAARNLRHGRGAVQIYEKAIGEAIDNCEWVVFVSTKNSRNMGCDALKVELKYIKTSDIMNAPAEFRKVYSSMPHKYKKNRIEYRLDNDTSQDFAERAVNEFFSGYEFAYSPFEIASRIYNYNPYDESNEKNEAPTRYAAKYCAACGTALPLQAKLCFECGRNGFVETYKDYELIRRLADIMNTNSEDSTSSTSSTSNTHNADNSDKNNKYTLDPLPDDMLDDLLDDLLDNISDDSNGADDKKADKEKPANSAPSPEYLTFTALADGTYGVKIKDKENCPENLVIPDTYNGKKVTEISKEGFKDCASLTNITIPDSVTSIGKEAFWYCASLTNITIPDSVTSIGNSAFFACKSLTSITIPNGVTSIGFWAFKGCKALTSITIPDSVKSIDDWAFDGCHALTEITVPSSVSDLGDNPFREIPLANINIARENSHYKKQNNCIIETGTGRLVSGDETSVIPGDVKSIGDQAFFACEALTSITIPDSVTSIGNSAFFACKSLTSITIPDSVTSIGNYAFDGCNSLKEIIFKGGRLSWWMIKKGEKSLPDGGKIKFVK